MLASLRRCCLPVFGLSLLALSLLAVAPATLHAQAVAEAPDAEASMAEAGELKTVAVVALSGYDELLADIDFLGELGGRPATADMIEGMLAFFTGGRGVEGLDKDRPLGLVLQTDGSGFTPMACLPIPDATPLLELAENFGFEPLDLGDGVYELELQEQTVFFRQTGAWTFFAQAADALEQAPADPSAVLSELTDKYDLGLRIVAPNVPEMYRQIAIEQLRQGMEEGTPEQADDETDEEYQARVDLAEANVKQISDLIDGLDTIVAGWNIDAENRRTFLDAELTGLAGSDFALAMSYYEDSTTGVTAFHRPGTAFSALTVGVTPPELIEKQRAQIEATIKMFRSQAAKAVRESDDLPDDPEVRETLIEVADDLIDVYEAAAESGRIELGMSLDLAGEGFDAIAGAHTPEPQKVEEAFKKLAGVAPKIAAEQGWNDLPPVEWNAGEHAGVTMHALTMPLPPEAGRLIEAVGESIRITMGVGQERVYVAVGPRGEEQLKAAIDGSAARVSEEVLPGEVILSIGQVLKAAEPFAEGQAAPVISMLVESLEEAPENTDRLVVTTEAIDNGVKVRYLLEEGVLKAIGQAAATAAQMQQQQAAGQGF